MKYVFSAIFGLLALLSLLAWRMQPPPDGKLTWVSDDNPRRKEQIELFNAEQTAGLLAIPGFPTHPPTGLKLDPNNTGLEKVIVQSLAGVGPDLFDCYGPNSLAAYVRSGVALDITEALKARGLDVEDIWPSVRPSLVYNGRVYGWPTNATGDGLWMNKAAFEEEGVALPLKKPWTWEEFLSLAQRMTRRDSSGRVIRYGFLADWAALWPLCVYQWKGHFYTPDGTRCILDSPEAIAGVQFAQDLIYKHRIMPSPVEESSLSGQGGWGQGTIKWFGAGKGAMALGGRWWLCTLRDQTHPMKDGKLLTPTLRLDARDCPHGPLRVVRGGGRGTLISASSPRAQEAMDFLIYMSRKPYNDLINAQADALAPVKKYNYTENYLHDPNYPEEDYNDVWRTALELALPEESSPFVDGQAAQKIIDVQLDLVKSNQKSAEAALRDAARKINAEIQKMVAADPTLRRRYEALTRSQPAPGL